MSNNVLQFKRPTTPADLDLDEQETVVFNILSVAVGTAKTIGDTYNVSAQTVRNIKMLKTARAKRVYERMTKMNMTAYIWEGAKRFTPKQIGEIRGSGKSSIQLGKEYGCSASTIRMIKTGKTYAD